MEGVFKLPQRAKIRYIYFLSSFKFCSYFVKFLNRSFIPKTVHHFFMKKGRLQM
jgi:hypothetical protein